jgi:DNA-binding NarL/FixJ family response regulator
MIAQDLSLSESTVEKYVSVVLRKLNLTSRAGLLVYVMQNQLSAITRARQVGQRAAPALS